MDKLERQRRDQAGIDIVKVIAEEMNRKEATVDYTFQPCELLKKGQWLSGSGSTTSHHENGKRKATIQRENSDIWVYYEWFDNGNKKKAGKYDNSGLMCGPWLEWNLNGKLYSEGIFEKGEAAVSTYGWSGKDSTVPIFTSKGRFKNNKKEGNWLDYYTNGRLSCSGDYKEGKKDGTWISYYINGKLNYLRHYEEGRKTGKWIECAWWGYRSLEYVGDYKDDVKHGFWTYYEDIYADDTESDENISLHHSKVHSKGNYVNGKKHGVWYFSFSNGPSEDYGEPYWPVSSLYDHGKFVKRVPLVDDPDLLKALSGFNITIEELNLD